MKTLATAAVIALVLIAAVFGIAWKRADEPPPPPPGRVEVVTGDGLTGDNLPRWNWAIVRDTESGSEFLVVTRGNSVSVAPLLNGPRARLASYGN